MEGEEDWISRGMEHLENEECPFCAQSVRGVDLIAAYRSYFNETYTSFARELAQYQQLPARHYSDDRIELMQARLQSNASSTEVWNRYVKYVTPTLNTDIRAALRAFRTEMVALLEKKAAAPLEPVELSGGYVNAHAAVVKLMNEATAYNDDVDRVNEAINAFKRGASPAHLQSAINELRWLELAKKRREPAVSEACDRYKALSEEKTALDVRKAEARDRLAAYSTQVCEKYCQAINGYLRTFSAGFRLDRVRVEYTGRIANSTFCVVMNDTSVEMGNSETPVLRTELQEHPFRR
jgi:wobble nucleotide-excising tRNase